jgi:hypothetical protein
VDRRALGADNTSMPTKAVTIYHPPGTGPRPRRRSMTRTPAPTYRIRLERVEASGQATTVHQWGGIPQERVKPILETLTDLLPWLQRAAATKDALRKLAELFGG